MPRRAAGLQRQGPPAPTRSCHQAARTRRPGAGGGRRAAVAGRPACAPRSRAQTRRPSGARRAAKAHTCPAAAAGSRFGAALRGTGGREGEESGRRRGACSGGRRTRLEALDAAPQAPPHHGPEAAALPLPVLGLARAVSGARAPQPRGSEPGRRAAGGAVCRPGVPARSAVGWAAA